MTTAKQGFLGEKSIAVVGVSRSSGFGNLAFRELKKQGYQVYPVNNQADTVEGEKCYHSLDELPGPVGGVLVVVPKAEARKVAEDCARLGIKKVWLQHGSESPEAIKLCEEKGVSAAHHACVMMYAHPKGLHAFHRFVWKVVGKL